jgi:hypothetical protein
MNTLVTNVGRAAPVTQAVSHPPLNNLHPGVLAITAGAYTTMILVLWLGFATADDHYLPLAIFTVVLAAFIGVPWLMASTAGHFWRRHPGVTQSRFGSFRAFLHGSFRSGGGEAVSGPETLVLIALIPTVLALGLVAMAFIAHAVR